MNLDVIVVGLFFVVFFCGFMTGWEQREAWGRRRHK
jgi:hypothetical protein